MDLHLLEVEAGHPVPLVAPEYPAYALLVAPEVEGLLHVLLEMVAVVELHLLVLLEEEGEMEPPYALLEAAVEAEVDYTLQEVAAETEVYTHQEVVVEAEVYYTHQEVAVEAETYYTLQEVAVEVEVY